MKRRSAERTDWTQITQRRFHSMYLDTPEFTGYRTLLVLDAMSAPFWTHLGKEPCCVADTGFIWLQHFPAGARHTLTTMFDQHGRITQWYIDICAAHGIDERGIPWFDDLYLDIVVSPSGESWLLDADELEKALRTGLISRTAYDLAHAEARLLLDAIAMRRWPLLELSAAHLAAHRAVLTAGGL
ncbi:MAG: DUF402 domain-containing protein [Chloroflexota bacterium]